MKVGTILQMVLKPQDVHTFVGFFFLQSPVLIFLFFPLCIHIRNHEREGKKCHLDYK